MTLSFPNQSRSYDPESGRIRFWGYDRTIEVSFLLEQDALFRLYPRTEATETAILAAFDRARDRIVEVAARLYKPGRRSFYVLSAVEF